MQRLTESCAKRHAELFGPKRPVADLPFEAGLLQRWASGSSFSNAGRNILHFGVNPAIRSQQFPVPKLVGLPVELRHGASRFLDQQDSSSRVPGMQAEFPEAFKAAAGHGSQIESSRAVPPHSVGTQSEIPIVMNIGVLSPFDAWKSGHQQTRRERFDRRNVNFLLIQVGALTFGSGEEFSADRVENDPQR